MVDLGDYCNTFSLYALPLDTFSLDTASLEWSPSWQRTPPA